MSQPAPAPPKAYLTHLNGLRALAILAVLFYHLRAEYCPAGYFGVDAFLVISGFLLFRSLLREGGAEGFHYGHFLVRKAWRLLPVWFVVTALVCVLSVYLLGEYLRVGPVLRTARSSATFMADYHIDKSGDYFDAFSQQNPLLHFWYLSVTQQLYLVAPLLVVPLARFCSRRAACILLGVLALVSLVYYVCTATPGLLPEALRLDFLRAIDAKSAYYHLIPRFWEVVAGAAILLLPAWGSRPWLRAAAGLLGLAGLVVSFYLYGTGSPSVYLAVVSTVLALRYADGGPAARLLALRPLQAVGTISFSLYLWHWPVMVFWKYCCFDAPSLWDEAGMLVLSLALAALSWLVLERLPMPRRTGWVGTLLRCSVLLLLPLVLFSARAADKHEKRAAQETPELHQRNMFKYQIKEDDPAVTRGLERMAEFKMERSPLRMGHADVAPSFLVLGDSHSLHLYCGLDTACKREGVRGVHLNNSVATFWYIIQNRAGVDTYCWNEGIANMLLDYLRQHPEIRAVLISQAWCVRINMYGSHDWRTGKELAYGEERTRAAVEGLAEFCARIRALGKVPVLLGDTPHFENPAPIDEWMRCRQLGKSFRERRVTETEHCRKQELAHRVLPPLADGGKALYIDLAPAVKVGGAYPAMLNGEWLYEDTNHLSFLGSCRVADYLLPRLLPILRSGSGDGQELQGAEAEGAPQAAAE